MSKLKIMLALCLVQGSAFSQSVSDSTRQMDEVVVTANKFPQKQSSTGKVLTVITQEQIQKSAGRNVGELLNQQVGLTVNGSGNTPGTVQFLYTRGAAFANTLILIDGIPLNDPSNINSEFDLNTFPLYQIERIEILKGAQSTLYGSDAVAGVVNIITKKKGNKPFGVNIDFNTGSFGSFNGNVALLGTTDDATYHVSYSKIKSKGFSSAYDSTGKAGFDNDGYNQDLFEANFTQKASEHLLIRVFAKSSYHRADIDAGAFTDDKDYRYTFFNLQAGAGATYHYNNGSFNVNYHFNKVNRHFIDDSTDVGGFSIYQDGLYEGTQHYAEFYNDLSLNSHLNWMVGTDYRRNSTDQEYTSTSAYGPFNSLPISSDTAHTEQFSAYTSFYLKNAGGFNAELGGRWNHHSIYGNNFTGSFNPSYLVNDRWKLFVNVASAYRVPSLYELYSEYGNRNLKPETSLNYEGGVQFIGSHVNARVTAFQRDIKNVFFFYTDMNTFQSFYINEDKQQDHGVEAEVAADLGKWRLSANYAYVDGKITTAAPSGKDTGYDNLYRRPKNTFNVNVGYQATKRLYLSTHLRSVSDFLEPVYGMAPIVMKGYYVWDAFAQYQWGERFRLYAGFYNLTDQKYFESRGFNSKPFNWSAGLSVSF